MGGWSVYIIRTRLNTLYTGIATDVSRRLREHESGGKQGAKYLRSKGPLEVVYMRKIGERNLASRVEHAIKKLARVQKDEIVRRNLSRPALARYLNIQLNEGE